MRLAPAVLHVSIRQSGYRRVDVAERAVFAKLAKLYRKTPGCVLGQPRRRGQVMSGRIWRPKVQPTHCSEMRSVITPLSSYPLPVGRDGVYYLLQSRLRWLIQTRSPSGVLGGAFSSDGSVSVFWNLA
jgi:hypothetical protein